MVNFMLINWSKDSLTVSQYPGVHYIIPVQECHCSCEMKRVNGILPGVPPTLHISLKGAAPS
jgi:hypothetical protein